MKAPEQTREEIGKRIDELVQEVSRLTTEKL